MRYAGPIRHNQGRAMQRKQIRAALAELRVRMKAVDEVIHALERLAALPTSKVVEMPNRPDAA